MLDRVTWFRVRVCNTSCEKEPKTPILGKRLEPLLSLSILCPGFSAQQRHACAVATNLRIRLQTLVIVSIANSLKSRPSTCVASDVDFPLPFTPPCFHFNGGEGGFPYGLPWDGVPLVKLRQYEAEIIVSSVFLV